MEKGFESWFRDQQIDWQSPDPNSLSSPFGLWPRLTVPASGNMLSPNGSLAFSAHQSRKASVPEEPRGWFYGLSRYRQGFIPATNSNPLKEQLPVVNPEENRNGNAGVTNGVQKKFLVFDQSGDQTTLIYSSGVGAAPIQYHHLPPCNPPKPQSALDMKKVNTLIKKDEVIRYSYPFHVDESTEDNVGDDVRSEMREDTEELNALLYSDDEIDSSENEETSTGHSPSTMTAFEKRKCLNESGEEEEVASSGEVGKRRKLENGGYNINSLDDTANSGKSSVNCSDDAELSYCGGWNGADTNRTRKEKVSDTITFLRNLIPGSKNGKDAMIVIDEAIDYLRSLKDQAKALGLDSL